jgi:hypothetical protein
MYRNDAITLIQGITGKSISDSRKYLDRIIDLHQPEFDKLKTNLMALSGTKSSHFEGIVRTYVSNDQGIL